MNLDDLPTETELDRLDDLLAEYADVDGILTVVELDGYLTAMVVAPSPARGWGEGATMRNLRRPPENADRSEKLRLGNQHSSDHMPVHEPRRTHGRGSHKHASPSRTARSSAWHFNVSRCMPFQRTIGCMAANWEEGSG